jgi:hypothetical protein
MDRGAAVNERQHRATFGEAMFRLDERLFIQLGLDRYQDASMPGSGSGGGYRSYQRERRWVEGFAGTVGAAQRLLLSVVRAMVLPETIARRLSFNVGEHVRPTGELPRLLATVREAYRDIVAAASFGHGAVILAAVEQEGGWPLGPADGFTATLRTDHQRALERTLDQPLDLNAHLGRVRQMADEAKKEKTDLHGRLLCHPRPLTRVADDLGRHLAGVDGPRPELGDIRLHVLTVASEAHNEQPPSPSLLSRLLGRSREVSVWRPRDDLLDLYCELVQIAGVEASATQT